MTNTDRDLLLAVLALQTGLVRREVLLEALSASGAEGGRRLGAVLREQHGLGDQALAALETLGDAHLLLHGNDPGRSLAAIPNRADVEQLGQTAGSPLGATLNTLGVSPTLPVAAGRPATPPGDSRLPAGKPAPSGPAPAARMGRFRILRSHARGALGEVFVAQDEELQREVALKEIQARHGHNPDSRARFLLEAEVTGRLEHPGIVPVYGLGLYDDGRPYYAMRFIRGDNFEQAIERFHSPEARWPSPGAKAVEFRKLLGRFLGVCDAIAYAHSKGVLHRDLKPANIMLGSYGETLVVDWGLAKVVGSGETPAARKDVPAPGVEDSAATQAGTILGTPAYMSPEQARGDVAGLSPASDVYSLGATLYCLLTGKPPFGGRDVPRTLEQVRLGQFPPPRAVKGGVARALEAICLKAMSVRPGDRYASARALADDLEHWLADEPVLAYSEPWWLRVARWRRRHQTLVSTATVLCLTALLALGVSYALLVREQGRTRQAETDRVNAQVDALLDSHPQAVPALLDSLEPFQAQVTPRLRELIGKPGLSTRQRTRACLALLRQDPGQLPLLRNRLTDPEVDPEEMLLLRQLLESYRSDLNAGLWEEASREDTEPARRFRCLVTLARFDPDNPRWPTVAAQVVEPLLSSDPLHVGVWANALEPVRGPLTEPLSRVFRDPDRLAEPPGRCRYLAGLRCRPS